MKNLTYLTLCVFLSVGIVYPMESEANYIKFLEQTTAALLVGNVGRTGMNQFICTHPGCNKSFAQENSLLRHLIAHMGGNPYVCNFEGCGKSFSRCNNLARHVRSHHKK